MGTAAEAQLAWPQGAFLDAYAAIRAKADQAAIENNPVALAILSLMDGRKNWTGTATELRQTLRERFPAITEDSQSFPRSPSQFGNALRRVQPVLRREGVRIGHSRQGKAGVRVVEIER